MSTLHLNLKGEYFDQIKSGEKKEEYRLYNAYWKKRLVGREYDSIVLNKGYPKRSDLSRRILRPWRGFKVKRILHPHFGRKIVKVFAIRVNE